MNIQPTVASLTPQGNAVVGNALRDAKAVAEIARPADNPQASQSVVAPADRGQVEAAAASVRDFVEPINNNLEFSVDDDTGRIVVKIVDRTTKEVIRQMPSEEMLAIAKALDNIKGLFVRQTA